MAELRIACAGGRCDDIARLLDRGADVDLATQKGVTPLWIAAEHGHLDAATLLLDRGAAVDRATTDFLYRGSAPDYGEGSAPAYAEMPLASGVTPLAIVCQKGHADVAILLLDRGSNFNRADRFGNKPLHYCCMYGHTDVVTLLLDRGASVDGAGKLGMRALDYASARGHVDTVRRLCDRGADVNYVHQDGTRMTSLFMACEDGHLDVATLLLDRGADIDCVIHDGSTPLTIACCHAHFDVVQLCVKRGADINLADYSNYTALEIADYYEGPAYAPIVAWLARILAAGGWARYKLYLSEPRYKLVVLRTLVARGRARREREFFGKEQLLDLLFPGNDSRGQLHLPDEVFSIIVRYYWSGEPSKRE